MSHTYLLVLAALITVDVTAADSEPAAAANPDPRYYRPESDIDEDHYTGAIVKIMEPKTKEHKVNRESFESKVIDNLYSPDYKEPIWTLDYRYQKTGGRDYTQGPGGQILILPKNVHTSEHKEFNNYDEFLEFLRLKNLANENKKSEQVQGQKNYDADHHEHYWN